jgi:hypothetical protein
VSDHTVTIEFEQDGGFPRLTFKCVAAADAHCRNLCAQQSCEEGCIDPENHKRDPLGYCNNVEWLTNNDDAASAIAGKVTDVTIPIDITWESDPYDGPSWRFAPAPNVDQTPLFGEPT